MCPRLALENDCTGSAGNGKTACVPEVRLSAKNPFFFEALGNALGCVGESGAWPQAGRRAIDQAWNSYWGEVLISSRKDSVNSSRQSAIAAWSSAMAVAPSARVPSSSTQYDCSGDCAKSSWVLIT